jgi:sialate O-acetylesterase
MLLLWLTLMGAVWQECAAQQGVPRLLHGVLQNHAVLQRGRINRVRGSAGSGEIITVTLEPAAASGAAPGNTAASVTTIAAVTALADAAGGWSAELPALQAGGPFVLSVRSSSGLRQDVEDVLVGDVFLCSGQSNMDMQVLRASNSYDEIRNSSNDTIRMLGIRQADSPTARTSFKDAVVWQVAGPQTVPDWSAVCFFFARELQAATHVPIGLIQASWGGANIRPWISAGSLQRLGGYEAGLELLREYAANPVAAQSRFASTVWEPWWREGSGDSPGTEPWKPHSSGWRAAPERLGDWRGWGVPELKDFTGSLWYRTRLTLTPAQARALNTRHASLTLGSINQVDQTWLNGQAIGNTFGYEADRTYEVPQGLLHAGENVLVTNIMSTYGPGGLLAKGAKRALHLPDGEEIPLAGAWEYRIVPTAMGYPPRTPWEPVGGLSTLYNAMIAPLADYGLRGALWYQGESNTSESNSYRALLETLMADWRGQFGADLPFLIVQLPNYGLPPAAPEESGWAQVREAERLAVAHDAHAGLAVTIDIGDAHNLHPTNKQDVARRLATAARHVIFGASAPASGPAPLAATRGAGEIEVQFRDVTGELLTYSHATPIGFELCGDAAGSCRFAAAQIEGSRVLLPIPPGAAPTRVRYCWADSPICTLADRSRLPATPFELRIKGTRE